LHDVSGLHILLVENGQVDQNSARKMLARMGLHADLATEKIEALKYLACRAYDIVLIDLETLGLDGLEIARIVRESWMPAEQPYIIAMATHDLEYGKGACFNAGMDGFMRKPLIEEELEAAILSRQGAL